LEDELVLIVVLTVQRINFQEIENFINFLKKVTMIGLINLFVGFLFNSRDRFYRLIISLRDDNIDNTPTSLI